MRLAFIVIIITAATASLAQTQVNVGEGGVDVTTPGVEVKTGGSKVKVKAGNTTVQTGKHGTAVKVDGVKVDAEPAGVTTSTPPPKPARAAAPLLIEGAGRTESHTCLPWQDVKVEGSGNTITLHGTCQRLSVDGSGNQVEVDEVADIAIEGSSNSVSYHAGSAGRPPSVTKEGVDNKVALVRSHGR